MHLFSHRASQRLQLRHFISRFSISCVTLGCASPLLMQADLKAQMPPAFQEPSLQQQVPLANSLRSADVLAAANAPKPLAEVRIERYKTHYEINSDYSYSRTTETLTTLLTPNSLENWQRSSASFSPDTQRLELVEAYVIQPDGRRLAVEADKI